VLHLLDFDQNTWIGIFLATHGHKLSQTSTEYMMQFASSRQHSLVKDLTRVRRKHSRHSTVYNIVTCTLWVKSQQWKRLFTTVAKQRKNGRNCCFLWGPFTGYIARTSAGSQSWKPSQFYSEAAVFREELQSCRLVMKANGSCGIGRQATREDTVRRLGEYCSELWTVECIHCNGV
jgi:hypothetical protein